MCWCDPKKRTPFCGRPGCHPPVQDAAGIRADVVKLLELLAGDCEQRGEHDWHKCRRCLAIEELGQRGSLARRILAAGALSLGSGSVNENQAAHQALLEDVAMVARRGLSFGHQATPQTPERMVERKDQALGQIVDICAKAGVSSSVLRATSGLPTHEHCPKCGAIGRLGQLKALRREDGSIECLWCAPRSRPGEARLQRVTLLPWQEPSDPAPEPLDEELEAARAEHQRRGCDEDCEGCHDCYVRTGSFHCRRLCEHADA